MIQRLCILVTLFSFFSTSGLTAQDITDLTYKQVDTVTLKMSVYKPADYKPGRKYPAMILFFGGGWINGKISQFDPFAKHFSSEGLVVFLADYRVSSRHGTTPFESLKDAKSAIRYLRKHADSLGIDPDRLVAGGGSAGGHLAAACTTNETINEPTDDLNVSTKAQALILYNPVIDNSAEGYGYERVKDRYLEFSPLHNIKAPFPPTIFFLGTKDKLVPVSTAQLFRKKIEMAGGRCELFLYEGQQHGFFNQVSFHPDILSKCDQFLKSIGYIH